VTTPPVRVGHFRPVSFGEYVVPGQKFFLTTGGAFSFTRHNLPLFGLASVP
jgi:hypothetical protein